MANKLFLKPLSPQVAEEEYLFDWALYDLSGRQIRSETTKGLSSIEQTLMQNGIEEVTVHVLWPAMSALSCSVNLPNTNSRLVQQALPFAVEEKLAQDLDSVHLAHGSKTKQGEFPVIGVDKLAFAALVDALAQADALRLKSVVLDAACLSAEGVDYVLVLDKEGALLKSSQGLSLSLAHDNLLAYMELLLSDNSEEYRKLDVIVQDAYEESSKLVIAQLQQYDELGIEVKATGLSGFELACESYLRTPTEAIDLCQGAFRIASNTNSNLKRWRGLALVASIAFLLQLGVFIGKGLYYEQEAERVGEQALVSYQKLVPGSKKLTVSKLARVIKGKLNQNSQTSVSDSGLLELLGEAGYQYQRSPARQDLSFKSINYNEQRGVLMIELHSKTFEQLSQFKDAIASAGLSAKIGSSVQENGYFRGRITVSGS